MVLELKLTRMANGKWQMANGKWQMLTYLYTSKYITRHRTNSR
jgi:hypothetical protein